MFPKAERALRKLVAEIGLAGPEDIEAILAVLGPDERRRVMNLLGEFSGVPKTVPTKSGGEGRPPQTLRLKGLSPWLTVRLDRVAPSGLSADDVMAYAMTAAALRALDIAASPRDAVTGNLNGAAR